MATENSVEPSAKLPARFISLPFLLLSFSYLFILVVLEIDAQATVRLDRDL